MCVCVSRLSEWMYMGVCACGLSAWVISTPFNAHINTQQYEEARRDPRRVKKDGAAQIRLLASEEDDGAGAEEEEGGGAGGAGGGAIVRPEVGVCVHWGGSRGVAWLGSDRGPFLEQGSGGLREAAPGEQGGAAHEGAGAMMLPSLPVYDTTHDAWTRSIDQP